MSLLLKNSQVYDTKRKILVLAREVYSTMEAYATLEEEGFKVGRARWGIHADAES